jgi:hypothetical protein
MQEQARLTRQEYSDAVLDVLMVGHGCVSNGQHTQPWTQLANTCCMPARREQQAFSWVAAPDCLPAAA